MKLDTFVGASPAYLSLSGSIGQGRCRLLRSLLCLLSALTVSHCFRLNSPFAPPATMANPDGDVGLMASIQHLGVAADISRATTPGMGWRETNGLNGHGGEVEDTRTRPRIYQYYSTLPYPVETEEQRQANLMKLLEHLQECLYIGDFNPGALHWTREIKSWLSLKFNPTKEQRVKMVKLFYDLSLAPGMDATAIERFSSMFMVLTK